jgi:hypothetical protein
MIGCFYEHTMHCWICGSIAETREHMIKASDLSALFGRITTSKPLYRKVSNQPRELVQGVKSKKLTFQTKLCAQCNNTRTQPHDKSWEALALFIRKRATAIQPGEVIRPARAFDHGLRPGLLGVHLYFVKLTGCLFHDAKVPIDTSSFAQSILNNVAHPNIHLAFLAFNGGKFQKRVSVTPIEIISVNGRPSSAQWFYIVGNIGVHVAYAEYIHRGQELANLWHPSSSDKTLTFGKLKL